MQFVYSHCYGGPSHPLPLMKGENDLEDAFFDKTFYPQKPAVTGRGWR